MTYAEKLRQAKSATYGILAKPVRVGVYGYAEGTGVRLKWWHTSKPGRRDQIHFWEAKMPNGDILHLAESDFRAIWYRSAA